MKNDLLEWKIKELPSINNHVHNTCELMNKWGNSSSVVKQLLANRASKKLKKNLKNVSNIHFSHDFNILFGNLIGKSIWFTDTHILDYTPIYFWRTYYNWTRL